MYYASIRQKPPAYEKVWFTFIGSDGFNHTVPLPGFPQDKETFRKSFSEHRCTIAESVLCLGSIRERLSQIEPEKNPKDTLEFISIVFAFFEHLGRARDNVERAIYFQRKINEQIRVREDELEMLAENFFRRHTIIHGKAFSSGINEDSKYLFPILRKSDNRGEGWDKSMNWSGDYDFQLLAEVLADADSDYPLLVKQILENGNNKIQPYPKDKRYPSLHHQRATMARISIAIYPTKMEAT